LVVPEDPEDVGGVRDATLARAWRYIIVAPLLYRVAQIIKEFLSYFSLNGGLGLMPTLTAMVFTVVTNVAAVVLLLRTGGLRARVAQPALLIDLGVGVVLNLFVAATAPHAIQPYAVDVSWIWMVSWIAGWTCVYGISRALWALAAAIPFRGLLTIAGGLPLSNQLALNRSFGCLIGLPVAVITAAGIVVLLGIGARFALNVGILRGLHAERRRTRRMLHDSVLQTLDALAMTVPDDERDAGEQLAEFRAIVKTEAAELRRRVMAPLPSGISRSLVAELTEVATEMARDGLRTELVAADFDDNLLTKARRAAIRDAVREALRNAVKHAKADQVVLRVEERDGGIAVVARDHGRGFDLTDRPAGFGISESIVARLAEVGGHGVVDSRPGHGTKVTMWVPK
jgi:signal transduction histidine kinase